MWQDRFEAGVRLAERLGACYEDPQGLILALPRGGVVVGYALSLALRLPLDVFIVRKLGAPGNPEFAIGAVTETGSVYMNPDAPEVLRALSAPTGYLDQAIRVQREEIARRQALYRQGRPLPSLAGQTVLLVDDGIATGATFFAAVEALRQLGPARLLGAVPVGPPETLALLAPALDRLVVLETPAAFLAVGEHYRDFRQVEDELVLRYLAAAAALRGPRAPLTNVREGDRV